ncbi:hypothetical protein BKA64DRAFT_172248 [Cadophora sp. MPI-SDFR-AT-0126]|nr:hypothetical protein BKA64DRAFT_172248 [Leotiomycetes sp. MPI-SDFR-AT-0126]
MDYEIYSTFNILFGCSSRFQKKALRGAYASIDVPLWFINYKNGPNQAVPTPGSYMKTYPPHGIGGMKVHLTRQWPYHSIYCYTQFPRYAQRFRELRNHMDTIKPQGLRGLFRDKRDATVYHTFWFAVIFGTTSIIFALASLLVSSLQTWAAFHPQTSNSSKLA